MRRAVLTWRLSDRVGHSCHAFHRFDDRQSVSYGHCMASPAAEHIQQVFGVPTLVGFLSVEKGPN
jgi:hypothetical protein